MAGTGFKLTFIYTFSRMPMVSYQSQPTTKSKVSKASILVKDTIVLGATLIPSQFQLTSWNTSLPSVIDVFQDNLFCLQASSTSVLSVIKQKTFC